MRRGQTQGISRVTAGLILVVVVSIVTYFGFTKAIPFKHHFEIKADFKTSNNLRKNSFVRIGGVNVGKVTKIEPLRKGDQGVRVTMRIDDVGKPIHKDATVKIRPRIFLEGNFFLDIQPGTPSAPKLGDGDVISSAQTSTPVQIDQILTALQSNTRARPPAPAPAARRRPVRDGRDGLQQVDPVLEGRLRGDGRGQRRHAGHPRARPLQLHQDVRDRGERARPRPGGPEGPRHRLQHDRGGVRGRAGQPRGHGSRAAAHVARRAAGAQVAQRELPPAAPPGRRPSPGDAVLAAGHQGQPALRAAGPRGWSGRPSCAD